MAAHRRPFNKHTPRDLLTEILDFGQESTLPTSPELTDRIRKVKEKIEEINQRIARLSATPK